MLIVNADDFGLTRAVSDAVIAVHKNGSASSASLMATMPAAEYAAGLAKKNPGLGVGLHFTLTEGFSAQREKTPLAQGCDGRFFKRSSLVMKIASGLVRESDIRAELEAQYARLASFGLNAAHIDSHQHVHVYPTIFRVVMDFARAKGIPVRVPHPQALRRLPFRLDFRFVYREAKHLLLSLLLRRGAPYAKGVATNGSFNSVFDIYPFRLPEEEDYQALIMNRRTPVHELMVHPYVLSEQLREIYDDAGWFRRKSGFFSVGEAEFRVLAKFSIREWLESRQPGLRFGSYRDLGRACA